jgi:serine/threonine protein kinase/Tol biopolymer transport system component
VASNQEAEERLRSALADRYSIEKEIGSGGMATVYLAEDLKHNRQVAVKVLKPELSAVVGPERFLAEIETTANLQHPNILPLFDSGEADGLLFYVMPFVEGESLRERLDREKQLPVDEAIRIAGDVAEALQAAHEQGVIHRDIKPANILLSRGKPLVADFGIALAVSAAGGSRLTETGLSLGTPHYISPEQASADQDPSMASDVYSLGCVLYEMFVGEPPHTGSSAQQILTKIVLDEARPLRELRKTVPLNVEAAVATALEKLPADRFGSATAFGEALAHTGFRVPGAGETTPHSDVRGWRSLAIGGITTTALLLGLAAWGWLRPGVGDPRPVIRSSLDPPPATRLSVNAGFALSPDGRRLAFVARDPDGVIRLWVQSLAALEARSLEGTQGAFAPFWSPDGRDLGFFAGGSLKRVPASGGAVQVLAEPIPEPRGGTWSPEGRIVYAPDYRTGLFEVAANGGEARALTALDVDDGEVSHRWPQFLPDGRTLLFLVQTGEPGADDDRSRIEALDPDGARHEILGVNASAAYTLPGQLLFWRGGSLYAQEFDGQEWQLQGDPQLVVDGVGLDANEWAAFSASGEGTLVYHLGLALPWRLEWRDRSGSLLSVEALPGDYSDPALSPDGRSVAYVAEGGVWLLDVPRGTRTRLTFEEVDHYSPAWSPDGAWVAYPADKEQGAGGEIYRRPSSGLSERELLFAGASGNPIRNISWSRDGRWLAFEENGDVFLLDLESREVHTAVAGPGTDGFPRLSPDGRWLAYTSDESGRSEVYVVATFGGGRRWQVSSSGGSAPRWSAGGNELFFLALDYELRVAAVDMAEAPEFGVPEPLFAISGASPGFTFDLAPDGQILVRTQTSMGGAQSFKLILNWPQLLGQPGL